MDIPGLKPFVPEIKFFPDFIIGNPIEQIITALNDPNYTIQELGRVIDRTYHDLLRNSFLTDYNNREQVLLVLSNEKFLRALISTLSKNTLCPEEIICCNKIVYDYKCQKRQTPSTKTLMLELSHTVNKELVDKLSTIIDRNNAENLALVSRSSFKPGNNVRRANSFIIHYCEDITPQELEYIFGHLYKDQSFKSVFNTVMFDVWDGMSFKNHGEVSRYNMIYEITMQIVNLGMTTNDIYSILMNYKAACDIMDHSMHTRFNVLDLGRFPRIAFVYQQIERSAGV